MSLSPGELEFLGKGAPPGPREVTVEGPRRPSLSQSVRLDLRGFRAEAVGPEVERFLDQAARSQAPSLAIIHGKGTGVVRKIVQDYLKESPVVDSFRLGDSHEGGAGVTVVTLK
ncbi:MAG TPA: Smr/MutS family protein [Candidatus Xenobia bacterium]|jgi:DNA mismatch repair protein MutS2